VDAEQAQWPKIYVKRMYASGGFVSYAATTRWYDGTVYKLSGMWPQATPMEAAAKKFGFRFQVLFTKLGLR
jgi:hypothetical protein